ncbi:MAG: zinc-binding dehydrogenase [Haloferacaceae archaeon]
MEATAAVLREHTDAEDLVAAAPAALETVELPDPGPEEVLVEITAASLCHTDVSIVRGEMDRPLPMVMGHEGTGVVRAVGEGVDTVEPGDAVVLGRTTCGRCEFCRAGEGQHCVHRSRIHREGTLRTGGTRFTSPDGEALHHCHGVSSFSTHTLVTEEVAIKVTDDLPPEQATLLGCGVFTGAGAALNTADVEAGASVAVFGAGGVGLSTVQGARLSGAAQIIAVDLVGEKLAVAEEVGATHTVDSSEGDAVERVRELSDGGVDYAFDVVGHAQVTQQAVDCLAPLGQAVLVGTPPAGKDSLDLDLYDIVTSEKEIVGSFNGSYTLPVAIPKLAELAAQGKLQLEPMISATRPLSAVTEAMHELETGTGIRQVLLPDV